MNILVIGSKGFIGTHCLNFFRQKNSVFGCDVVTDFVDKNYFLIDATNADFKEIFEKRPFDVCINCSGAASVADSIHHPRRDFELNTMNVFKLLDAIRQFSPGCKFVQISSAAVYGNPAHLPVKETNELSPISPYGWHKLYSEQLCREFVTFYNSKVVIVRPFSVYGIGLKKQLFWDVYQKIKSNAPFQLYGTGKETRDFIHISDLLYLIELIIEKGEFNAEVYNAANGNAISINEVVDLFVSLLNCEIKYTFGNQIKEGDPLYWQADVKKITALNYIPKKPIKEGLKEYLEWAKENA
jgi:UDP-glucose 4-epimerase